MQQESVFHRRPGIYSVTQKGTHMSQNHLATYCHNLLVTKLSLQLCQQSNAVVNLSASVSCVINSGFSALATHSAGIHAILSTQSLSDIEHKGGDALVGQIVSNCNNFIIQRQNYPQDAEQLANIIGTFDRFQVTSQVDARLGSTALGSVRQTKEFIVHPDEIKRLPKGEGIVVNKQKFQVRQVKFKKA